MFSPRATTSAAFERFLALLDSDREVAGQRYEMLRASLLRFFRWRGGEVPEDLADETLSRAAEKCPAVDTIDDVTRFVHGIARLVALEDFKAREREQRAVREASVLVFPARNERDEAAECLDECLAGLSDPERNVIVSYYSGDRRSKIDNRAQLAAALGVSVFTLRVRAHRMRERLEACLRGCLERRS